MILAPVSFGDGVAGSWFPFTDPCLLVPQIIWFDTKLSCWSGSVTLVLRRGGRHDDREAIGRAGGRRAGIV